MTLHTAAPRSIVLRAGWGQLRRAGARVAYDDMHKRTHRTNTCCDATPVGRRVSPSAPRLRPCADRPKATRNHDVRHYGHAQGLRRATRPLSSSNKNAHHSRAPPHPFCARTYRQTIDHTLRLAPSKFAASLCGCCFATRDICHIERTTKAISFHDFVARLMDNASSARRTALAELRRKNTNDHRVPNPT